MAGSRWAARRCFGVALAELSADLRGDLGSSQPPDRPRHALAQHVGVLRLQELLDRLAGGRRPVALTILVSFVELLAEPTIMGSALAVFVLTPGGGLHRDYRLERDGFKQGVSGRRGGHDLSGSGGSHRGLVPFPRFTPRGHAVVASRYQGRGSSPGYGPYTAY